MEADLHVPERAIGFIASGQAVYIGHNAFPLQRIELERNKVHPVLQQSG
jgi:hypothetical protein